MCHVFCTSVVSVRVSSQQSLTLSHQTICVFWLSRSMRTVAEATSSASSRQLRHRSTYSSLTPSGTITCCYRPGYYASTDWRQKVQPRQSAAGHLNSHCINNNNNLLQTQNIQMYIYIYILYNYIYIHIIYTLTFTCAVVCVM